MNPLSLIPAPYQLIAKLAAVAVLALALYLTGRSHGADAVQSQWTAERLVQTQTAHAAEIAARAKEQSMINRLNEAQNAAIEREKKLAADAAAARAAAGSLRDTVAALRRGLPDATPGAISATADTALAVFGECQARYGAVAEASDGCFSDRQTLIDAWPR